MGRVFTGLCCVLLFAVTAKGQKPGDPPRAEQMQKAQGAAAKAEEQKAKHTSVIHFEGEAAFNEKELRAALKEQIGTIDQYGLSPARADDVSFFLELFYRKHGYTKISVRYTIESGDRLRLQIDEGPLLTLGTVLFAGNEHEPEQKLFDYMVGPTRQRYSKLQKKLPYVPSDLLEGADLVHRFYIAEGFLDAVVDKPSPQTNDEVNQVDVTINIHEGRQYFFGNVSFEGKTIYDPETLRGQIKDLLDQPYTDGRVADIPRRLQSYYKSRGYFAVKVTASGEPTAARDSHVPVRIAISTGPLYHFGDVSVTGLKRLDPDFVENRFNKLQGKVYSPEVVDERFRALMRTGLFNLVQINPVAQSDDTLQLQISAEEAKSKEFGVSGGYGTYEGLIGGLQFRERDLFGTGHSLTASTEVSQRSYKGELLYEDLYFLNTDVDFKARVRALTFDFNGYSKFEIGGRLEAAYKLTKQYQLVAAYSARHVEVTSADIKPFWLGPTSYFIDTIGFAQTLDLRDSPYVSPRGLVLENTLDVAADAIGSQISLIRSTLRAAYFIQFAPKSLAPGVATDSPMVKNPFQRFFQQSSLAFGARTGIVHSLDNTGPDEATTLPIDERFFNGGASSVRSFQEFDLGPHDKQGHPVGGEFYTVFNGEYTFPIFGELQGAVFVDAGNLLPTSEDLSLDDMRYAVGIGLRYKLPIGPIRLDYGFNPDPRPFEDSGAFHFSFGFAF